MDEQRKQVSRRVRQLREDIGVSQTQLASSIGVAPSTISGIETGAQGISGVADKLATALGTTTDYLYGLTDNPLPPDEDEDTERVATGLRAAILDEFERLDEIDQQILYQMAMTLRLARERRNPRVIE